jgi:two-component system, LytTR family, response regulator
MSVDNLRNSVVPARIDGSSRPCPSDHFSAAVVPPAQVLRAAPDSALMPTVLVGERQHRLYVLPVNAVDYIESHGNYVKLHAGNTDYISRDCMNRLSLDLRENGFIRIERRRLINIRSIHYAQRLGRGVYAFTLLSGQQLCSGITYREAILQALPLARAPSRRFVRRD